MKLFSFLLDGNKGSETDFFSSIKGFLLSFPINSLPGNNPDFFSSFSSFLSLELKKLLLLKNDPFFSPNKELLFSNNYCVFVLFLFVENKLLLLLKELLLPNKIPKF